MASGGPDSDQALHKLIHDDSAMNILTEFPSNIGKLGNSSAHGLENPVSGMLMITDYLKAIGHVN